MALILESSAQRTWPVSLKDRQRLVRLDRQPLRHAHKEAEKKAQVAELRQRYLEGRLNTHESAEKAASKILGAS